MMKKLLSTLMCVSLILSALVFPVHAVGEELETEIVNPMHSIEENAVRNEVNLYFEQRELILTGQSGDLSAIIPWHQQDENNHQSKLSGKGISRITYSLSIHEIIFMEICVQANVTESVTYSLDNSTNTIEIEHEMYLGNNDGQYIVVEDRYYDHISDFASCSYVPPSSASTQATGDGSSLCVINIAHKELGYTEILDEQSELGKGYTIYGDWYGYGCECEPWCGYFVAWCAHFADVPTDIIPKRENVNGYEDFFIAQGTYYKSQSQGGSARPQIGDVLIMDWDTDGEKDHVGFVFAVNSNSLTVIDGNWDNKVDTHDYSLTSAALIGYGRPAYSSSGHIGSLWFKNSTHHWKTCENCNTDFNEATHSSATWITSTTQHWKVCNTCGGKYNVANHSASTWTNNGTQHWHICSSCNIIYNRSAHSSTTWVTTPAKHWKVCSTCNNTFSNASHTFTVDPLTGAQYCTVCRYGQGAVINKYENTFVLPD